MAGVGDGAQLVELVQAGEAADEEAGVDRPCHPTAGGDSGDDGDGGDLVHVPGGEAASPLRHQDDAVGPGGAAGHQRGQGEVAGAPEHDVALGSGERRRASQPPAVHDHGAGADGGRRCGEREPTGHLSGCTRLDGWETEKGGRRLRRPCHESDISGGCCVQREDGGDRGGALAATCPGDDDHPGTAAVMVTGDHPLTRLNMAGRRGTGRASPTRPDTPTGLVGGGHRAAARICVSAW